MHIPRRCFSKISLTAAIIAVGAIFAGATTPPSPLVMPPYFIAFEASQANRDVFESFATIDRARQITAAPVWSFGGVLGRRFELNSFLRLAPELSVRKTSFSDSAGGGAYTKKGDLLNGSLDLTLQGVYATPGASYWISGGGGVGFTRFTASLSDESIGWSVELTNWGSWAILAGAGADFKINKTMAVAVAYSFRYLDAFQYDDKTDLPLSPLTHSEAMWCHGGRIGLLFDIVE